MNLQIYKPNSKNTGCAMSFQISTRPGKEPEFYANCVLQHSWNNEKRTGSFAGSRNDPSKTIALKFNEFELGEMINTFTSSIAYSTFHNFSSKTQIRLTPYKKTRGKGDFAVECQAFGMSFVRNGSDTFKIPFDPGEAIRLTSLINKYFSILDDYRLEEQKKYQKERPSPKTGPNPQKTENAPKSETEEEYDF